MLKNLMNKICLYFSESFQQIGVLKRISDDTTNSNEWSNNGKIYPLFRKKLRFSTERYQYWILDLEYYVSGEITKNEYQLIDIEDSRNENGEVLIGTRKYQILLWDTPIPPEFNNIEKIFDFKYYFGYLLKNNTNRIEFILLRLNTKNGNKYFAYNKKYLIIPVKTNSSFLVPNDIVEVEKMDDEYYLQTIYSITTWASSLKKCTETDMVHNANIMLSMLAVDTYITKKKIGW